MTCPPGTASSRLAHFAVFPERFVEKPILAGSPTGGLVLDPFCGRGTPLAVAKQLGRRSLGIQLKAEYAELARARVANAAGSPPTAAYDGAGRGRGVLPKRSQLR